MPLTDAQIRGFKPESKRFRQSDGQGLFLEVMPSGKKIFRLAYRLNKEQRTVLIGEYPEIKLADARLKAAEMKRQIREGRDPKAEIVPAVEPVQTQEPLWKDVAKEYIMLRQRSGAAARTMHKLIRQIEVTMAAHGDRTVTDISPEDILSVVNPIAESGCVENAHEIRTRYSQVFRYAGARGLIQHDPSSMVIGAMIKRQRGEFAGITDPKQVGKLMLAIHYYRESNTIVGAALLLSAYLFPRNTELRGMRWDEIDWDKSLWNVPASRMKMKRDHLVPLPAQAIAVLRNLQVYDFGSELVFPSPRDPRRMCSDATFNQALRRCGYGKDTHVHHGFRTTASTNLNEMGWNSDWIEVQLAHLPTNKVRSAYNKAQYLVGRTQMMQAYADWLDTLCAEANEAE